MAESKEELKSLLMKEESEKAGSKLNIQKRKITASSPITSWQIDGETTEIVTDLIFLGSKIIADGDCSYKIKRCLLLGRKAMTQGQPKGKAEIPVVTRECRRNSRNTTWLTRHHKMRPLPATASQEKSHVPS